MLFLHACILGLVEGITEFLPISSTGHMILVSGLLGIPETDFLKTFEIAIQLGAILAVIVLYYRRFLVSIDIYLKLAVAFIPTGIMGFLLYKIIKTYLFHGWIVSIMLILGGIIFLIFDKWTAKPSTKYKEIQDISYADAVKIGLFQCIAMIPGVSRAAATIFGGIFTGFNRAQAAEFSFLLAIPTMMAATGYDLLKSYQTFIGADYMLLGVGSIIAFISALLAVKGFIYVLNTYGFKYFGYYRIIIGLIFLAATLFGVIAM